MKEDIFEMDTQAHTSNVENIPIKSEMDYEDIDYSIIKEEVEVGPTIIQERHVDTVLFEISKFEIMDGSTKKQIDNNNTFLKELFTCDTCLYKAKSKRQLEEHTLSHSKIKNEQTKKVKRKGDRNQNKKVKNKKVCNSHRVNTTWDALYTKNGKFRSYTCDQCPYRTSVRVEVNRHKRIHTGQNLYECSICDYKTPFKSRHTRHQAVHSGVKAFLCDTCNFKSNTKENLIRHMGTHAPNYVRPKRKRPKTKFQCFECDKVYVYKANLVRHMRTHTGEVPFWCEHCQYKAREKMMLVRHLNKHIGRKPYSCDGCDMLYGSSEALVRHRKRCHEGKV